jgi:phosphotriesterase-related protein
MPKLDRTALKGRAQTVLGVVDPAVLGPTLMHEHVICDITPQKYVAEPVEDQEIDICNCWQINFGQKLSGLKWKLNQPDIVTSELREMVAAGGRTVVELTSGGLKPDPKALVDISQKSGAHLVMGCGHYVNDYQDRRNHERGVDEFAAEMVAQVFEGAWGTEIRAGIIGEIGCQAPWTELERRVMQGAIIAQQETGAAINVHPGRHEDQPQEVADFFLKQRAPMDRMVMSHIDRTIFDEARLLRLADTGCVIEFDLFGQENSYYVHSDIDMPNDAVRLRLIRALINHGHLDRVVISHDICYRTRLTRYGGHGYQHIFANVIPMMRRRGYSETEIDTIMVRTPKRLLTFV